MGAHKASSSRVKGPRTHLIFGPGSKGQGSKYEMRLRALVVGRVYLISAHLRGGLPEVCHWVCHWFATGLPEVCLWSSVAPGLTPQAPERGQERRHEEKRNPHLHTVRNQAEPAWNQAAGSLLLAIVSLIWGGVAPVSEPSGAKPEPS